jgi:hypothetical protein
MQHDSKTDRRKFLQQLTVISSLASGLPLPHVFSAAPVAIEPVAIEPASGHSLLPVMRRAAKCCLAWLNPDQHLLPTGGYEVAHDTGRWWDAMLRYEAVAGEAIPAALETAMLENLKSLTANEAALLTSNLCNPHNIRETLLTYAALIQYRNSDWARTQGNQLIATLLELLEADGQLNYEALAAKTGKPLTKDKLMMQHYPAGEWFSATGSTGRAIEAIICFYEVTREPAALKLAQRLAEVNLQNIIDPSGKVHPRLLDPEIVGHTHSYCGTLRGLLKYGLLSGETKYVDAVLKTYQQGLWGTSISYSGWTPHDQGKIRFTNKAGEPIGEHGSCGDVIQLALWLAIHQDQPQLLDDVERLIRARVSPAQIIEPTNPRRDGAWGVYNDPFGKGAILDVFAAVLHSLTDVQQHIVTTPSLEIVSINLHFDVDHKDVQVRISRDTIARVRIIPHTACTLRIRVPTWAIRDSVRVTTDGQTLPFTWDKSYIVLTASHIAAEKTYTLEHDLPLQTTVEEMPISHRKFQLSWKGDEVTACDPTVAIYPPKTRD